jgi:Ca2+-binding EF-hand superfamily protein
VIKNLQNFRGSSKLKKAALNVLVKMLQPKDIEDLKTEFMKVDTDNSGFIDIYELEAALSRSDMKMSADEL